MPELRWHRCLLPLLLALLALPVFAAPRIGVVTMQPGEVFWERFGHDAIVVQYPDGQAISYNYGFFDPTEPGFVTRFARGKMRYQLVALPLALDLVQYREAGRGVRVQWLNLTPAQSQRLVALLEENARPENARYDYDYFQSNCATRVRDMLDLALEGQLGPQLAAHGQGHTYRSEATRLAAPSGWMWLAFELGLGPNADRPLSRWQEAFIPMRLAHSLGSARGSDGRPLVLAEEEWLPHRLPEPPASAPNPWPAFAVAGLLLAAGLFWLSQKRPRLAAAFALGFCLLSGLAGLLLLYLWLGSAHWAAWRNHNLLLLNPLALLLIPGICLLWRQRPAPRHFHWLRPLILLTAVASVPLAASGIDRQTGSLLWIALLLPIHLVLFFITADRQRGHKP